MESNAWNFTILSCSAFNSAFVASVAIFLSKVELSINWEVSDLSADSFFIAALSTPAVNLL